MKHVICALLMMGSAAAFAGEGGVGHGGGVAYDCFENGQRKVYLADTYELTKAGAFTKFKTGASPESVIEAAVVMLEATKPEKNIPNPMNASEFVSIGWLVKHTSASLDLQLSNDPLPLQTDAHINAAPQGCQLAQLAIQDVGLNRLKLDLKLWDELSDMDRGLFKLHEIWISIRNQPGADTTPIRAQVSQAAAVLADPNFSESAMIAKLIAGPEFIRTGLPTSTRAEKYVLAHCNGPGQLLPGFNLPTLSEAWYNLGCPTANRIYTKQLIAQDKKTALPTLTAMPKQLNCQIVSHGTDMLGWNPTAQFRLVRTAGTGMSYSPDIKGGNGYLPPSGREFEKSKYEIRLTDGTVFGDQVNEDLLTHRHERQRGIDELGDLDFRVSFTTNSNRVGFFINQYSPMTNLFYGDLTLDDNGRNYTAFGIACTAPYNDAKFDKDLYGSYN